MYIYIYIYTHTYIHVRMFVSVCLYITLHNLTVARTYDMCYVHIQVYLLYFIRACACVRACVVFFHMHGALDAREQSFLVTFVHSQTYDVVYLNGFGAYVCVYAYIHMYIYIYIDMHTCIHECT